MENSSSKPLTRKQARKASKRKKLEGLLRIAALNDQDRQAQTTKKQKCVTTHENHSEPESTLRQLPDVKLERKDSNDLSSNCNDGPSPKRYKPDTDIKDDGNRPYVCVHPTTPSGTEELSLDKLSSAASPESIFPKSSPMPQQAAPTILFQPYDSTFFQPSASTSSKPCPSCPHFMSDIHTLHVRPPPPIPNVLTSPAILWGLANINSPQCDNCLPNHAQPTILPLLCGAYSVCNPILLPSTQFPVFPVCTNDANETTPNSNGANNASEEDLQKLRTSLKARYKEHRATPQFYLAAAGESASLNTPEDDRIPIFLSDIQRLILRAVVRDSFESRCGYFKHITKLTGVKLLLLEGLSLADLQKNSDLTSLLTEIFPVQMECIMPAAYQGALLEELAAVPLTAGDRMRLITKYGSLEAALQHSRQIFRVLRAFFPIQNKIESSANSKSVPANKEAEAPNNGESTSVDQSSGGESSEQDVEKETPFSHETDKFPRTHLLLSPWQMIEEGYPLPLRGKFFEPFSNFSMTQHKYKEVTPNSPMYGLDCEMCLTTSKKHELTRISIINEKLEVVYDTLVMPPNKIINYLTEFSGITAEMMKGVTTTLHDVQYKIREILEPDAILVGQSLNMDLIALKLMHPYVIDTSVIFNMSGNRGRKSKLRYLAKAFLQLDIQEKSTGHDPTEDAATALKLVQLKLAKSVEFGDAVLSQLKKSHKLCTDEMELNETGEQNFTEKVSERVRTTTEDPATSDISASVFNYLNRQTVSIIGQHDVIQEYQKYIYVIKEWGNQPLTKHKLHRPQILAVNDELEVIDKAVACMHESFCIIAHVKFDQSEAELLSLNDQETTERFNKIIRDFNGNVPENNLVLVILGGNSEGANGAVCLALRKKKFTPVHRLPTRND